MNVPEAEMAVLNYSSDIEWKHTPTAYGGGVEAQAEVFHQLHCLVNTTFLSFCANVAVLG